MNKKDLTTCKLGKPVIYNDEIYSKELNKYEKIKVFGFVESLLIDINFGAYGYNVRSLYGDCKFLYKCNETDNLTGCDLKELKWLR